MNFYSQNFEDVILWRCFKSYPNGFYVDVGAEKPDRDSVTKLFYDIGWQGINIEPQPQLYQVFLEQRPRDINVNAAISSASSEKLTFYSTKDGIGLAGFGEDIRNSLLKSGLFPVPIDVSVLTLDEVIQQNSVTTINFLKIDVEGHELLVLKSFSFSPRPQVVCVEVTQPNTTLRRQDSSDISSILSSHLYQHVYFDGLNDWWLATEVFDELRPCFSLPPNCLDGLNPSSITEHMQIAQNALVDLDSNSQKFTDILEASLALTQSNQSLSASVQTLTQLNASLAEKAQSLECLYSKSQLELSGIKSSFVWMVWSVVSFIHSRFLLLLSFMRLRIRAFFL